MEDMVENEKTNGQTEDGSRLENQDSGKGFRGAVQAAAGRAATNTKQAAQEAAGRAAASTKQAARDAKLNAQKAIIDKMQKSIDKAEANGGTATNASQDSPKKKSKLSVVLVIVLVLVVTGVAFALLNPAISSRLTGADYVSTSQLEKAVDIEGLSSAEFVYNGIAEKYKTDTDEVDYRVSYDATVKAGITMSDIQFDVDNKSKVITITLPEIVPSSVSVSMDDLDYMPENPRVEIKEVLELCEEDVKKEASNSESFYSTAEENLKAAIEALTMPIVGGQGYTIEWADAGQN